MQVKARVTFAVLLALMLVLALSGAVFAAAPDYTSEVSDVITEQVVTPLPPLLLVVGGLGILVIGAFKGLSMVYHAVRKVPTR